MEPAPPGPLSTKLGDPEQTQHFRCWRCLLLLVQAGFHRGDAPSAPQCGTCPGCSSYSKRPRDAVRENVNTARTQSTGPPREGNGPSLQTSGQQRAARVTQLEGARRGLRCAGRNRGTGKGVVASTKPFPLIYFLCLRANTPTPSTADAAGKAALALGWTDRILLNTLHGTGALHERP